MRISVGTPRVPDDSGLSQLYSDHGAPRLFQGVSRYCTDQSIVCVGVEAWEVPSLLEQIGNRA